MLSVILLFLRPVLYVIGSVVSLDTVVAVSQKKQDMPLIFFIVPSVNSVRGWNNAEVQQEDNATDGL